MPIEEKREEAAAIQRRIVLSPNPVYVAACPGAGKTRVLVERAQRILAGLPSRRGLAILTFSNAAVDEIEKRFGHQYPPFPSFIGTFDSFLWRFLIASFGTDEGVAARLVPDLSEQMISPTMGRRGAKPMPKLPLRLFDRDTGNLKADLSWEDRRLTAQVSNAAPYEALAAAIWRSRKELGFLDYEDARSLAQTRIVSDEFRPIMSGLVARFAELIVDEAQDCNPSDLGVIQTLRESGLPVSVIGDPDQAIYGFRHGSAPELRQFAERFGEGDRYRMTGNFRSISGVSGLASLFREPVLDAEVDALRSSESEADGGYLLSYRPFHQTVPPSVGGKFTEILESAGIGASTAPVIAHRMNFAQRAVGMRPVDRPENKSFVVRLASNIGTYCAAEQHWRTKVSAVEALTGQIFEYLGCIEEGETLHQALIRLEVEISEFRGTVVDIIEAINPIAEDADDPGAWLARVKEVFERRFDGGRGGLLRLPPAKKIGELKSVLTVRDSASCPVSTIHRVKGQEFPAVCVVVPPAKAEELIDRLERGQIGEAERVLYVGLTRGQRIAALAVPEVIRERLLAIMRRLDVSCAVKGC